MNPTNLKIIIKLPTYFKINLPTHITYKYVRCFNFRTNDAMILIEVYLTWASIIILQIKAMKTEKIREDRFVY